MASITIHEIDDLLNERLTQEVRRRKKSKNQLIKEILLSPGEWIAASCTEHGARLLSFDSHFEDVDGLLPARLSDG